MSLEGASSEGVVIELRAASVLHRCRSLRVRCQNVVPNPDQRITSSKLTPAREPLLRPLNIDTEC